MPPAEPLNVYDAADAMGCEVLFVDVPSAEGMYLAGNPPTIVLSSLRPSVRQVYTCAHELGHHSLGHGEVIDETFEMRTLDSRGHDREREADNFAAYFLMPPMAIDRAFATRNTSPVAADPKTIAVIAAYFQVGYATLVRHLQVGIKRISWPRAEELLRISPSDIRAQVLGRSVSFPLHFVDESWVERVPLDCVVDDLIQAPPSSAPSGELSTDENSALRTVFQARAPGRSEISLPSGKKVAVRIARKAYAGKLKFRWEPEAAYV